MSWDVIVWCVDCGNGQDVYGCFDGSQETLGTFETQDAAEAFAKVKRLEHGSPWQYDVEPTPAQSEER